MAEQYTSEDPHAWGYQNAMQDSFENCPFASAGGMDKRTAMEAPEYVAEEQREEYLKGYRAFCEESYGLGWETAEWGWKPAITIPAGDGAMKVKSGSVEWGVIVISPETIKAITAERQRQDEQWGGPEHDDQHDVLDWLGFIDRQVRKASDARRALGWSRVERERLVKIAALAVAALESLNRKGR